MRPSRLLLLIALGALALSVPAAVSEAVPAALVLILWAGLGLAIVLDLLLSPARRHLALTLTGPAEAFTNEEVPLALEISSRRALPRRIGCRMDLPEGLRGPGEVWIEGGGHEARMALPVTAKRRGRWAVPKLWLRWPSRLRLIEFCPAFETGLSIAASANIRPVQSGQIDVQVRSSLFGMKENMVKGEGSEFHQLRDWTAGMDTRSIDWKHSARHRTLVAKEVRAERNHHVVLALDNGFLMREEIGGLPKIDHSVNAALCVAWAAVLGGDMIGLYAFDSRPRLYSPPEPGRMAFARLRARTAELDYRSVETNHTLAMAHLHGRLKRRALVVVFSDFVDTTTAELLVENVAVLSRHHVIVFVALRDPRIEAIAEASPNTLSDVANAVSAGEMLKERQLVLERLSRLGVFVINVRPEGLTAALLSTYLNIKAREVI